MNFALVAQVPPAHPVFVGFEVQRCIRVMYGCEAQLYPIDPRQVEAVLEPVRNERSLNGHPNLVLILTLQPDGVEHALLDHCDGDIYLAVDSGQDTTGEVCTARFCGEAWRIVGRQEGLPGEVIELMATDSMLGAQSACAGLEALLRPVRVVLGMDGGAQQFIYADRPAELLVLDSKYAHQCGEQDSTVITTTFEGQSEDYAGEAYIANVLPDAVATLWDQLPSPDAEAAATIED